MVMIVVNGMRREVQSPADTPLLYVLKNDLELSAEARIRAGASQGVGAAG
jgi:aerobic-type carbon monoxide dehydrogenase small subunit (CoxS/CutS family)